MYTLQEFLNTLPSASSLIYVTVNGNDLFFGAQIAISEIIDLEKYGNYKVWRIDIYEKEYLWVDIDR